VAVRPVSTWEGLFSVSADIVRRPPFSTWEETPHPLLGAPESTLRQLTGVDHCHRHSEN